MKRTKMCGHSQILKRFLTVAMVFALVLCMNANASATTLSAGEKVISESYTEPNDFLSNLNEDFADSRLIRFESENEFYVERSAPDVIITEEDILVDNPNGIVVNDRPEDSLIIPKAANSSRATTNYIYGPYTNLSLSDDKMLIILNHLQNTYETYAVNYNGTYCFKFTSGNDILYINANAFAKSATGISSQPSGTVSTYLNANNSAMVYATAYKSIYFTYNNTDAYQWNFARFGTQAYFHSNAEIYVNASVERAFSVDVYGYVIRGPYPASISIKPTLPVNITNTGASSFYFGGYRYSGQGGNTSATNLGPIIQVGYKTAQAAGNISGLSVSTVYNLFNDMVRLTKGSSGSRTTYLCQPAPLTSTNIYSYSCSTPSPFTIEKAGDYCTMQLGLRGTKTSTTRFSVPCTFSIS